MAIEEKAAADIDSVKAGERLLVHFHFAYECIQEFVDHGERGNRIEVTVRTFAFAEGYVNVQAGSCICC
jgi:hypothetical protein